MESPNPSLSPVHVLHLDDDDEWAGLVDLWLGSRGFKVFRFATCVELRSYLKRCRRLPLCLLLDLSLRDGDGLAICDEVKGSPAFQHLPIVILTGQRVTQAECLRHEALYRVLKDAGAQDELAAVVESILRQQERTLGVIDAGDLRLDPRDRTVRRDGAPIITLEPGPFEAFRLLVHSAPNTVDLLNLYGAFLRRNAYHKENQELAIRTTVRNYISRLRDGLGPLGARIESVRREGYVYKAPSP